jgi:hypothetical protein
VVVYKYSRGLYAWALTIIPSQLFHIDYEPFFSFSFFFLVSLYEVIVSTSFKVEAFNDIHNITSFKKVEMILFQFEVA